MSELERIRDLFSQRFGRLVTLAECLSQMTEITLEKIDPVKKAERALKRNIAKREKSGTCQIRKVTAAGTKCTATRPKRTTLRPKRPARVDHAVTLRDQGRCTHQDANGRRCANRRWLHSHHLVHVSDGGSDRVENLMTLCSGHHRLLHFQKDRVWH